MPAVTEPNQTIDQLSEEEEHKVVTSEQDLKEPILILENDYPVKENVPEPKVTKKSKKHRRLLSQEKLETSSISISATPRAKNLDIESVIELPNESSEGTDQEIHSATIQTLFDRKPSKVDFVKLLADS